MSKPEPISVAIVEDDAAGLALFAAMIERAPDIHLASRHPDAESALAALPEIRPQVVLMDIHLPGINGVECVRQLKPRMPDTQFLMLTVYQDTNHIFEALAAGATGYLIKRASGPELIAAIREIHAGGSPMSSSIARRVVQSFAPAQAPSDDQGLTPREQEILGLLAEGRLYKEIAGSLGISVTTVNWHIRRIYEKLHVQSRGQAVARYHGLRPGPPRQPGK